MRQDDTPRRAHRGRVTIEFAYEVAGQQRAFERALMEWLKPITVVAWEPPRWERSEDA